jgi:hypothetical protein
MSTMKYLLYGALGAATVLLLTSDKANGIRKNIAGKAKDNAGKWKDKFKSMGNNANKRLSELKDLLNSEMEGLSDDARKRIQNVLNGASDGVTKFKNNLA